MGVASSASAHVFRPLDAVFASTETSLPLAMGGEVRRNRERSLIVVSSLRVVPDRHPGRVLGVLALGPRLEWLLIGGSPCPGAAKVRLMREARSRRSRSPRRILAARLYGLGQSFRARPSACAAHVIFHAGRDGGRGVERGRFPR